MDPSQLPSSDPRMAAGFGSTVGTKILFWGVASFVALQYIVAGFFAWYLYHSVPISPRRTVKRPIKRLRIISHNLWLIPFAGPWCMGRVDRLATRLKARVFRWMSSNGGGDDNDDDNDDDDEDDGVLTIVAVQEAWAWRSGLMWPLQALEGLFQSTLLRLELVKGGREPLFPFHIFGLVARVAGALGAAAVTFVPLLRRVLWTPKPLLIRALHQAGLKFAVTDGEAWFAQRTPLEWPLALMDSGLLLCASHSPHESGFEPFDIRGNDEASARKGMLWGRFGSLLVVNTHMTFINGDGGEQRRKQHVRLAMLVQRALMEERDANGGNGSNGGGGGALCSSRIERVVVVGDFNSALPSQTVEGNECGPAPHGGSASVYSGQPWLPAHACLDRLIEAIKQVNNGEGGGGGGGEDGGVEVDRLSGDDPTCEDGTVDHVLCIYRAADSKSGTFKASSAAALPDPDCHFSDHLLIEVEAAMAKI